MSILQAIVLGLVQGLTEFLPVSSSGHLVLVQKIMGIDSGSSTFIFVDTMLHVGTLVAVIMVLRKEVWGILRHPTSKLMRMLIVATVPTVILALLLQNVFAATFEGDFLGISFLLTGIILIVSELLANRSKARKFSEANYLDAATMGVMQGVALIPGISRSGSTLAGGLARGINRYAVAKFAFLMAVPAIVGSVIFQAKDFIGAADLAIPWAATIIGTVVAAVSGLLAATGMLKLIRHRKLYGFAFYVFILGALVLLDQLVFHLVFDTPFL